MKSKNQKKLILSFQLLFLSINIIAQTQVSFYTDEGKNNVSEGFYLQAATIGQYKLDKFQFETGFQFDILTANENVFSGFFINASREFTIKNFSFKIEPFYSYSPFSDILYETNWGILLNTKTKHFDFVLGNNFRTYAFNKQAITDYDFTSNTKIHENMNLMYSISYSLKPQENKWNAEIMFTNIDNFIINQETNPYFKLNAKLNVSEPVTVFIEPCYKSSGSLNFSVNYFGFFFRTGLIWNIK